MLRTALAFLTDVLPLRLRAFLFFLSSPSGLCDDHHFSAGRQPWYPQDYLMAWNITALSPQLFGLIVHHPYTVVDMARSGAMPQSGCPSCPGHHLEIFFPLNP
jgi:hypothetical protein